MRLLGEPPNVWKRKDFRQQRQIDFGSMALLVEQALATYKLWDSLLVSVMQTDGL